MVPSDLDQQRVGVRRGVARRRAAESQQQRRVRRLRRVLCDCLDLADGGREFPVSHQRFERRLIRLGQPRNSRRCHAGRARVRVDRHACASGRRGGGHLRRTQRLVGAGLLDCRDLGGSIAHRRVQGSTVVSMQPRVSLLGERERRLDVCPARRASEPDQGVLACRGRAAGQDAMQLPEELVGLESFGQQFELILEMSDLTALNRLYAHQHSSQLREPGWARRGVAPDRRRHGEA